MPVDPYDELTPTDDSSVSLGAAEIRAIKAGYLRLTGGILPGAITDLTLDGTPLAPTATLGSNTRQIATTAFVQATAFDSAGLTPANQTDAQTGTDNTKWMSPLRTAEAITAQRAFASQLQAEGGSLNTVVMSPLQTKYYVNARLASPEQAQAGTDNLTLMTPLRVAQSVAKQASLGKSYFYGQL